MIKHILRGSGPRYFFSPSPREQLRLPVFYEAYAFVLAFVGPQTTNHVSQHLSCCPVTLASSETFSRFVFIVRFQLSQAAGLQTAKGDRNHL